MPDCDFQKLQEFFMPDRQDMLRVTCNAIDTKNISPPITLLPPDNIGNHVTSNGCVPYAPQTRADEKMANLLYVIRCDIRDDKIRAWRQERQERQRHR